MSQSSPHCRNQPNAAPPATYLYCKYTNFPQNNPRPHQPPRATARSDCHGSAPHELARYQKGDAVCAYICKPDEIVGKHYWIWYDFKTAQPRCEPTPPPADRYIPEAFKQQMTTPRAASVNISQGAGIRFSSPSLGGSVSEEQGFALGGGVPDDFKHFLEMHPGMSFEEAKHRFRDEQKAKQLRKGPKLH